jgi:hypothetical protein
LWLAIADSRLSVGQDRVQPAGRVNRAQAVFNVFPAAVAEVQPPVADQIRRHLEPLLKVELSFASRAADLNDPQRRALVAAARKWFDEFVVDFAKGQDRNEQQLWLQGMQHVIVGRRRGSSIDPRESIESGVAKLVADTLPKEKVAAYEHERATRAEFYRDVAIANVVACVDEKLLLSPEQRLDVTDELAENWDSDLVPGVEVFTVYPETIPDAIDLWVRPELTASQRTLLNRMNKLPNQGFIGGMAVGGEGEVIDDIDLDETTAEREQVPRTER